MDHHTMLRYARSSHNAVLRQVERLNGGPPPSVECELEYPAFTEPESVGREKILLVQV